MLKIRNKTSQVDYFDSFYEWLEQVNPERVERLAKTYGDSWRDQYLWFYKKHPWSGGRTYYQEFDRAKLGIIVDVKDMEIVRSLQTKACKAVELNFVRDVTGDAVDVGTYISGEPECMFTTTYEETVNFNTVNIIINGAISSSITPKQLRWRGLAMLALVETVQALGKYRLNVYYTLHTANSYSLDHTNFIIKLIDSSTVLSVQTIAYALIEPAMERQLSFGYNDTMTPRRAFNCGVAHSGRGTPSVMKYLPKEIDNGGVCISIEAFTTNYSGAVSNYDTASKWIINQLKKYEAI